MTVPAAVEKECCGGKKTLDGLVIQKAIDENRIRRVAIKNRRLVAKLEADFNLGKGEAEAIAVVVNEKAELSELTTKMGSMRASCWRFHLPRRLVFSSVAAKRGFWIGLTRKTFPAGKAWALQTADSRRRQNEIGGKTMSKTMSVRMDRENYEFLHEITREEGSDLSKAVRDMVTRGRILFAVEQYKKGEASLGRAAELAGVRVGHMMNLLTEFGVESRMEQEDSRDSRTYKTSGRPVSRSGLLQRPQSALMASLFCLALALMPSLTSAAISNERRRAL